MLQIGNGPLSIAEQRSHFALWAITKSTLILGSKVEALSPEQLSIISNRAVIGINQDPLGIQARKLAINGSVTPHFVGVAPCSLYEADARYPDGVPGPNGVTKAGMVFHAVSSPTVSGKPVFSLVSNETGRCIGLQPYVGGVLTPALMECSAADPSQAWTFPTGSTRIGAIQSVMAVASEAAATVLAVSNSTLYGIVHGGDTQAMLDGGYGDQHLGLAPYNPEPPCDNRNCQDYDPSQSWYWSPRSGTIRLAAASAEGYRCYEPGCYQLTSHLPAYDELCLARVASISAYGVDPSSDHTGGTDVYGGPLDGGHFALGLLNRNAVGTPNATITAKFEWLEDPTFGAGSHACVRDLFSGVAKMVTGSVEWSVTPHDMAMLRVVPGTSCVA